MELLDSIPVSLELEDVLKELHVSKERKSIVKIVQELIEIIVPIAKPKALYEISYVDNRNQDSLYIDGVKFTSRVLRVNLDKVERVFPYIATCGTEVDEIDVSPKDVMKDYCLDKIKEMVLDSAIDYVEEYLTKNYALGELSEMNPGSLEDWPVTQQRMLFSLFDNVEDLIGVELNDKLQMVPLKSVSGIYFQTEVKFESCQLCPRKVCIARRALYDLDLVEKYQKKETTAQKKS